MSLSALAILAAVTHYLEARFGRFFASTKTAKRSARRGNRTAGLETGVEIARDVGDVSPPVLDCSCRPEPIAISST